MSTDSNMIVSILGPVVAVAGTWMSTRWGKKGARELALVEQWRVTAEELERDVARLKREARMQSDYINRLRLDCIEHGFRPEDYPAQLRDLQEGKNA